MSLKPIGVGCWVIARHSKRFDLAHPFTQSLFLPSRTPNRKTCWSGNVYVLLLGRRFSIIWNKCNRQKLEEKKLSCHSTLISRLLSQPRAHMIGRGEKQAKIGHKRRRKDRQGQR